MVTSQFPLAGEPNRGRPLLQTARELSRIARVRVLSPVARYPRWARPRSYVYRDAAPAHAVAGCDVAHVGYPALPALSRPFNGRSCARALEAPLRAFAPDVVLAYWLYPDAYGAMLAARQAGVPLVAGARGSDLRVRDALSRALTRPVLQAASRILVVSQDLGRVAVARYGADPARLRTIPNGCDAGTFHPRDRTAARAALGVGADERLVVYVGRLVPEKGLRELLAAVERLSGDAAPVSLALVGDGPMRGELDALAAGRPRLRLAGAQDPPAVARWMCAADVVTLPSWSEGHPNVLVESLACGRPVVATPVGGVPEVVDESTGLLVPPRDPVALAQGLRQALEREWDADALAARFSRDWGQVARETLAACAEAVAAARA